MFMGDLVTMEVGDLVTLKYNPDLVPGVILKTNMEFMGYDNWVLVMFVGEEGPDWYMQYNLKLWSEDESG